MKPHISLNVRNVQTSVEFYQKVFEVFPQKQTEDYAKFDLTAPSLNFSLVYSPEAVSQVNHLGIEVDSASDITDWEGRLQKYEIINRVEQDTDCCYARQQKIWLTDPDGNHWEIFTVLEQLSVTKPLKETGYCVPSSDSSRASLCGCS